MPYTVYWNVSYRWFVSDCRIFILYSKLNRFTFERKRITDRVCHLASGKPVRRIAQWIFQVGDDIAESKGVVGNGGDVSWLEIIKAK